MGPIHATPYTVMSTWQKLNNGDISDRHRHRNSKSNKGRQAKNGGVKGRDGSAEELDRETVEEQATVGRARRQDGG